MGRGCFGGRFPAPLSRDEFTTTANFTPTVKGNSSSPAIFVPPTFVASGLTCTLESELRGNSLQFGCAGTRHARFRSCRVAESDRPRDTLPRSTGRPCEFTDRLFGSWHQGVTASNRSNLRHPAVGPVPVDCELIIVEAQAFTVVRKALAA